MRLKLPNLPRSEYYDEPWVGFPPRPHRERPESTLEFDLEGIRTGAPCRIHAVSAETSDKKSDAVTVALAQIDAVLCAQVPEGADIAGPLGCLFDAVAHALTNAMRRDIECLPYGLGPDWVLRPVAQGTDSIHCLLARLGIPAPIELLRGSHAYQTAHLEARHPENGCDECFSVFFPEVDLELPGGTAFDAIREGWRVLRGEGTPMSAARNLSIMIFCKAGAVFIVQTAAGVLAAATGLPWVPWDFLGCLFGGLLGHGTAKYAIQADARAALDEVCRHLARLKEETPRLLTDLVNRLAQVEERLMEARLAALRRAWLHRCAEEALLLRREYAIAERFAAGIPQRLRSLRRTLARFERRILPKCKPRFWHTLILGGDAWLRVRDMRICVAHASARLDEAEGCLRFDDKWVQTRYIVLWSERVHVKFRPLCRDVRDYSMGTHALVRQRSGLAPAFARQAHSIDAICRFALAVRRTDGRKALEARCKREMDRVDMEMDRLKIASGKVGPVPDIVRQWIKVREGSRGASPST